MERDKGKSRCEESLVLSGKRNAHCFLSRVPGRQEDHRMRMFAQSLDYWVWTALEALMS